MDFIQHWARRCELPVSRFLGWLSPCDPGFTNLGSCLYGLQMLRLEARSGAPGADVKEPEGLAGQERKGQGAAQDLAAAFAAGPIDLDHSKTIPKVIGAIRYA